MQATKIDRAVTVALLGLDLALTESVQKHMRALLPKATDIHECLEEEIELKGHGLDFIQNLHYELDWADRQAQHEATHTWLESCKVTFHAKDQSAADLARDMVGRFIAANNAHEFSYTSSCNPDDLSDDVLSDKCITAHNHMMAALSALSDEEAEAVLSSTLGLDHDGSTYRMADLKDVRQWQAVYGNLTIAQCRSADAQRKA